MRRTDRQVHDPERLRQMLAEGQVLHLGLSDGEGPYVVPLNYGYEEVDGALRLYFHSALTGKKVGLIGEGARCWVTITLDSAVTRADSPCGWSSRFASLMMAGSVRPLRGEEERRHGLDLIMRHHGFEGQPNYEETALRRVTVYLIEVDSLSGKQRA